MQYFDANLDMRIDRQKYTDLTQVLNPEVNPLPERTYFEWYFENIYGNTELKTGTQILDDHERRANAVPASD